MRLTDYKVLTFDCYGTLIDWERGIIAALERLTRKAGHGLARDGILEAHARHESVQQRYTPALRYSELLAVVYKRLAEEWGVAPRWGECLAYGRSVKDWPAFADSAAALRYLKKHYKLVILSNVDNLSFAHSARKLKVEFDAVFTAEDIGSYKPNPRNFEYMLEKLAGFGIAKDRHSAYRRKPVPRSRACQRFRARVMLDLAPARPPGVRRHHRTGAPAQARLPLHQHGRHGENPP